jgi:uncharacterized protein YecT (DUF1311 family)
MKFFSILLFVIIQIPFNLGAQECGAENLSYYDSSFCVSENIDKLNSELDSTLTKLKKLAQNVYSKQAEIENNQASASDVIKALGSAQHLWLTFINADCEYSYQSGRGGSGTGASYSASNCMVKHIKARLVHLNNEIITLQDLL